MKNISVTTGVVEVLGQNKFDLTGHVYSYLRFRGEDNEITMIKNLFVGNLVGSFVSVNNDAKADYHVLKVTKKMNFLFAYDDGENKVCDMEAIDNYRKAQITYFVLGILALPLTLMGFLVIIGFLFLPFHLFIIIYAFICIFKVKPSAVKAHLRANGFDVVD